MLKGYACNSCEKDLLGDELHAERPRVWVTVAVLTREASDEDTGDARDSEDDWDWEEIEHEGHLCADCAAAAIDKLGLMPKGRLVKRGLRRRRRR